MNWHNSETLQMKFKRVLTLIWPFYRQKIWVNEYLNGYFLWDLTISQKFLKYVKYNFWYENQNWCLHLKSILKFILYLIHILSISWTSVAKSFMSHVEGFLDLPLIKNSANKITLCWRMNSFTYILARVVRDH